LLAFLLYLPSLTGATIWDDHEGFMNNTRVVETSIRTAFTSDFWGAVNEPGYVHPMHYRPLALLAYGAVFRIFGMDPVAVHLADVLLHALATIAFACLLAGLGLERSVCRAGAFLFAVHPLHVEAVSWISGMSETLAGAATLATLALYVWGKRNWSLLFALCAMLIKESAITIPALIFILEYWRDFSFAPKSSRASAWYSAAWAAAPYVPLSITYLVVRSLVLPPLPPGQTQTWFLTRYPLMPAIAGRYLALIFLPWPMAFCYDLHTWTIPLLGLAITAAWIAIAWMIPSLRRELLLAGSLIVVFLAVPIAASPMMVIELQVQDRYAYLATAGACLALAVLLNELGRRWGPRGLLYLCLVLIPAATATTLWQERIWQTEEAMWARTLEVTPTSKRARFQLFVELARLQRPAEARAVCQAGLQYHPDERMFRDCLGLSKLDPEGLRKRMVVGIE
jgi:hypothetical protein